jgi:hypothetical protein
LWIDFTADLDLLIGTKGIVYHINLTLLFAALNCVVFLRATLKICVHTTAWGPIF